MTPPPRWHEQVLIWVVLLPLLLVALTFRTESEWPKRIYWGMAAVTAVVFVIIFASGANNG